MDKNFIGERISELRLKKNVSGPMSRFSTS